MVPVLLGFLIPALMLCRMAFTDGDAQFGPRFVGLVRNSFLLASATAANAVVMLPLGVAVVVARHVGDAHLLAECAELLAAAIVEHVDVDLVAHVHRQWRRTP